MKDIIFSSVDITPQVFYFIYIGEFKSYGVNLFFKEFLERRLNRSVDFIAIIPDIMEQYPYKNVVVINPLARDTKGNIAVRIGGELFAKSVSESAYVQDIINTLLKYQGEVYLYMHESYHSLHLKGATLIGPKPEVVRKLSNKLYQYEKFSSIVPMAEHRICSSLSDLLNTASELQSRFTDGMFVSETYSAAGSNSAVVHSTEEIRNRFKEENMEYLIARYIPHTYDPTVLAVAINENETFIAGVADQRIEGGNRFTGSTYPSTLDKSVIDRLWEYTRIVGRAIAEEGYRGIFGCDYIVTENNDIYFIELNARKQGTTMEFCCTLENELPQGRPNLPEIEFYAVTEERLCENAMELKGYESHLSWSTYNLKMDRDVVTDNYIPHYRYERETFRLVKEGTLAKEYMIIEHVGESMLVKKGSFLGRIISVANSPHEAKMGVEKGKKALISTLKSYHGG